jgi:hypothetical protein
MLSTVNIHPTSSEAAQIAWMPCGPDSNRMAHIGDVSALAARCER